MLLGSSIALALGSTGVDAVPAAHAGSTCDFAARMAEIHEARARLAARYEHASNPTERRAVRHDAQRLLSETIIDDVFPAWLGTPWHMGEDDDASVPHQPGKRVSCSMFVTAVLQNVGLRLDSRRRWAQAPALYIQRSLAPERRDLHRYHGVSPAELAGRLGGLPDGLYVIGLNVHVGFVVVAGGEARFVHSSYVEPEVGVTDEPVAESDAIAYSRSVGYWVTPLFQDDRLIDMWLAGEAVPLQQLGP